MARAVYTNQFFNDNLTAGGVVVFPVPDGYTAVIRDITGVIECGNTGPCNCTIQIDGFLFWYVQAADQQRFPFHEEVRGAAGALSSVTFGFDGGGLGVVSLHVTGYLLAA